MAEWNVVWRPNAFFDKQRVAVNLDIDVCSMNKKSSAIFFFCWFSFSLSYTKHILLSQVEWQATGHSRRTAQHSTYHATKYCRETKIPTI